MKPIETFSKTELITMTQTYKGGTKEYNYSKNLLEIAEVDPNLPVVCPVCLRKYPNGVTVCNRDESHEMWGVPA